MQIQKGTIGQGSYFYSHLIDGLTVLVEEDEFIRQGWEDFFNKCGMKLITFGTPEEFVSNFKHDGGPVEFFFDQDFGDRRGMGVKLAAYVQTWKGRTGTSLVTAYDPEDFEEEVSSGLLTSVQPKFPPSIFGDGHLNHHIQKKIDSVGVAAFLQESFGKLSKAIDRFHSETLKIVES